MNKIKGLFQKNKEVIIYIIFGVLTTLINFVAFYLLESLFGDGINSYLYNNAIAWVVAVIFAYITNKLFVFQSGNWQFKVISKEIIEFLGARVFSFVLEEVGLWLLIDGLAFGKFSFTIFGFEITGGFMAKAFLAVIVVIMNYFFSKFVIFKVKNNK